MARSVRKDLFQIYEAAVSAVKKRSVFRNCVQIKDKRLFLLKATQKEGQEMYNVFKDYDLADQKVHIIGAGKAVLSLCESFLTEVEASNSLQHNIDIESGILSVPNGSKPSNHCLLRKYNVDILMGAKDNVPDPHSVEATHKIIELLQKVKASGERSLFVCFISGGGSALLASPKSGLTLEKKRQVIDNLMKSGCDIIELNQVRRCLSLVKGGKLASLALQETENIEMVTFIASDIIGDPIELIASGPTAVDEGHSDWPQIAISVLKKYAIPLDGEVLSAIKLNEDKFEASNISSKVTNIVVVSNVIALKAARHEAQQLGYRVFSLESDLHGEASLLATRLLRTGQKYVFEKDMDSNVRGVCWVGGGETVVTMGSDQTTGRGGRCQEMCLSFYLQTHDSKDHLTLLAAGTDGQDGPTPVAGCICESGEIVAEELYQKARSSYSSHDSYTFWSSNYPQWLVDTKGPTGVNVMDIYCIIKTF